MWRTVAPLLREAGYTLVDPEVGELVTSLDMAGCSLTLVFLDDELEALWRAPADTPAYRKGIATTATADRAPRRTVDAAAGRGPPSTAEVDARRRGAAAGRPRPRSWPPSPPRSTTPPRNSAAIDAVAGDGDHGRGMVKGTSAAVAAATAADAGRSAAPPRC